MPSLPPATNPERIARILAMVTIIIVVAVLYVAKEVFVPLALALLFSFLLAPVVTRLERWRFSRIPAVLTTVLLAFCVVASVGYLVFGQLYDLTLKLPSYKDNIGAKIASIKSSGKTPFSQATDTLKELGKQLENTTPEPNGARPMSATSEKKEKVVPVQIVEPATNLTTLVQSVFGPILGPVGLAAIVVVFVLFMLIKREDLRDRIIHLIGRGKLNTTTQALDEAAHKVSGYLFMQVIINVSFGVPIGIGLFFIGVPNALLWGLLATLLRFVPYVGAWIALGFPLILSLAVSKSWAMPIETLGLFAVIELITSNVLEPWLYGAHTGLSPVAIMVATIFWTWLWGGVGLLLATPLTVCVAVLGKYIPSLSFLDAILGDEPTLSPQDRFYQRLLASDRREADAIAHEYLKDHSLPELYSDVFVAALSSAEREDEAGALEERSQRFIFANTREIIEELGLEAPKLAAAKLADQKESDPEETVVAVLDPEAKKALFSHNTIYCLPAADEADELVAVMLAQLLEQEGIKAESVTHKTLANEMVALVAEAGSRVVCISVTPPHNTLHTRYLCKLLRSKFPDLHIVVGFWDSEHDEESMDRRKERLNADKIVSKLTEALDDLRPFAALETQHVEVPALVGVK